MTVDTASPWPAYLLERASLPPPEGCAVVPGSTPVVSFGHPLNPEVATLGINPSSSEFLGRDKRLLAGEDRRLATLDSVEAGTYADIDRDRAIAIVDDCAAYFQRQPYRWFTDLDQILTVGLGVSYFGETASHLDLVQWATDPLWKELTGAQRDRLLEGDREFLKRQLGHEGYRVVAVAGRTALQWVQRAGLVEWEPVDTIEAPPRTTFYVGDAPGLRFVAWSCNVQSQHGARRHIDRLAELLREHAGGSLEAELMTAGGTAFTKGTHFHSQAALVEALERWLEETDEETIGEPSFGRAPWLSFDTPAGIADLNADTRRDAIERMLSHARLHPDDPWRVVENRRGSVNKVVFSLEDSHEGWYAYLRKPLGAPQELE